MYLQNWKAMMKLKRKANIHRNQLKLLHMTEHQIQSTQTES